MYYDVDTVDKKYAEIVASRAEQGESAHHIPQQTNGGEYPQILRKEPCGPTC
jgi:hypothetical protein